MQITCKCLNVAIETQGSNIQDVEVGTLNLSIGEKNDAFFKEVLQAVEHGRISKVQSSLVQVRNVGVWIIHCCINCAMNTHAIHRDRGAAIVLFNKALLIDPGEIAALKNSDKFSPVFRIVINNSDLEVASVQAPTKFAVSQLPAPVQAAISALQQQLAETIQQETTRTEEKVRQYSEQQYAALEDFREHAHHDHCLLTRLLCEALKQENHTDGMQQSTLQSLETPPSTPDNYNVPTTPLQNTVRSALRSSASIVSPSNYASPIGLRAQGNETTPLSLDLRQSKQSTPFYSNVSGGTARTERMVPSRLFGQSRGPKPANSFDAEGLFDLEGMEDPPSDAVHLEEDTDTDDSGSHDEGIHIPRDRGLQNLAKSLPVNVPSYLPQEKRGGKERDDERPPQDPMDIAASIKALAKSVHGDANVFGDLPRPRFSTQI